MTNSNRFDLALSRPRSRRPLLLRLIPTSLLTACLLLAPSAELIAKQTQDAATRTPTCGPGGSGLDLPQGFCADIFADNIAHPGHLVVAANGLVYVATPTGVVALDDTLGTGRANVVRYLGQNRASRDGGAGIAIYKGALYAEAGDNIVRYELPADRIAPSGPPETVVSNLPAIGAHPFAIDAEGGLFVVARPPGSQAGIWRYDANRMAQTFSPAAPFSAGIRDVDAIAIAHGITDEDIGLGVYATDRRGANQDQQAFPAARLIKVSRAAGQRTLTLFPGQWMPSDLALYDRRLFPPRFSSGAFVAFRAARPNGAPFPEHGGTVMFQPFANGKPQGPLLAFADGAAGTASRPSGLAVGPDGALYIADDIDGRIWRITYRGPSDHEVTAKS